MAEIFYRLALDGMWEMGVPQISGMTHGYKERILLLIIILEFKVFDLLHQPGSWNLSLLGELFPIAVVNKICAIRLSSNLHADRWIWQADKRGFFFFS